MRASEFINQELDEGWKQKAAAGAIGAAMALGAGNLRQTHPEFIPEPIQQVQKTLQKALPNGEFLKQFLAKAGLVGNELNAFMAQAAHETLNFTHLAERGSDQQIAKKYDPKFNPRKAKILGNKEAGDGVKYKGRGFLHITGRYNYKMAGKALGLPLEEQPELLEDPEIGAKASLWYWNTRVKNKVKDFSNVRQTTKTINPGMKGMQSRMEKFKQFFSGKHK